MKQGVRAQYCLDTIHQAEKLSGDATCNGLIHDWDFNTNLANNSPCFPVVHDAGSGD